MYRIIYLRKFFYPKLLCLSISLYNRNSILINLYFDEEMYQV